MQNLLNWLNPNKTKTDKANKQQTSDLSKRKFGEQMEKQAEQYLNKQGLTTLRRNYHCKMGEIDLIMMDQEELVFVEVRFRQSIHFGDPLATVDERKQQKLRRAAEFYLVETYGNRHPFCRFDVIGMTLNQDKLDFNWVRDGF